MIYKAMGNLHAIQILLGHSKIENTVNILTLIWRVHCCWPSEPNSDLEWPSDPTHGGPPRSGFPPDRFWAKMLKAVVLQAVQAK